MFKPCLSSISSQVFQEFVHVPGREGSITVKSNIAHSPLVKIICNCKGVATAAICKSNSTKEHTEFTIRSIRPVFLHNDARGADHRHETTIKTRCFFSFQYACKYLTVSFPTALNKTH